MTRPEILQRLAGAIADSEASLIDADQVSEATTLESFGVDSLVLIDLIFDIEQEFDVKLDAEQLTAMKTMGDLVSHLETRLGA